MACSTDRPSLAANHVAISKNTFDVGPVESFFNELYYPGLAAEIFSGRRPHASRELREINRRQPASP